MKFQPLLWLSLVAGCLAEEPAPPTFTFLYSVNLTFPRIKNLNIGQTPLGNRVAWPIEGGAFDGPTRTGKALYGLDYGFTDGAGTFREDTVYYLETDDGALIYVRALGIGNNVHHTFETSAANYTWLNSAIAYARGRNYAGGVGLDVWAIGAIRTTSTPFAPFPFPFPFPFNATGPFPFNATGPWPFNFTGPFPFNATGPFPFPWNVTGPPLAPAPGGRAP